MIEYTKLQKGVTLTYYGDDRWEITEDGSLISIPLDFVGAINILEYAHNKELDPENEGDLFINTSLKYSYSVYLLLDSYAYHLELRQLKLLGKPANPKIYASIALSQEAIKILVKELSKYVSL